MRAIHPRTLLALATLVAAPSVSAQVAAATDQHQLAVGPSAGPSPAGTNAADPRLWAFEPLRLPPPPTTGEAVWDAQPIDRFVRSRQQAAGLAPNPPADRRTLLRRASFALTGLPPTPAAVEAFVADQAPDAWPRAIDALLASPHYGEQQARHWLDLARYSDSNGLDENLAFAQAFRYRDWVVRAHNEDLPFDRFGSMQLAGDLLAGDPAVGLDGYTATGFLALGPRMLAEQDKEKLVLDTVDEQVDLVGRTFLGLTLGCARCHDHKFDPVPTRDYYALAGIFRSTKSFHELGHVSKWFDRELATDAQITARKAAEAELATAEQALQQAHEAAATAQRQALVADAGRYLLAGAELLQHSQLVQAESSTRTSLHADATHWGSAQCVVLHTHKAGPQFAEWDVTLAEPGQYRLEARFAAQESRPMRLLVDGKPVVDRALAETTGGWLPAQQRWHAVGELDLGPGAHVLRLEALGDNVPHLDALLLSPVAAAASFAGLLPPVVRQAAIAQSQPDAAPLLELWNGLRGHDDATFAAAVAARQGKGGFAAILLDGLPPTSPRELAARYQTLFATAGAALATAAAKPAAKDKDKNKDKAAGTLADPTLEAARALLFEPGGLLAIDAEQLRQYLPAAALAQLDGLTRTRDARKAAVPPKQPIAMCVGDGEIKDLPVHVRGSHLTLAPTPTPRGGLSALANQLPCPPMPAGSSGRAELAAWLFDARQVLVQRVLVNRIWQRAFGQGLVRSPSNFGVRGDVPVQRELLDWLAADFQAHGWSQKHVWRTILLSQTWQQRSDHRDDAAAKDPENRLLWRQQRVRLGAEAVRDAILATAGSLDRQLGGTLLRTEDRGYVTNDQSNNQADYEQPRRSLYLPVIRNAMFDLFAAFDYCDPSVHIEQRPSSAVATQALLLLNAPFVRTESARFAARAAAAASDDEALVGFVWSQAFCRAPEPAERAAAGRWLAAARAGERPNEALTGLCQALFASNEFVYVD